MANPEETDLGMLSGDFPKELSHYLLVAVGEPISEEFSELMVAEIEKGECKKAIEMRLPGRYQTHGHFWMIFITLWRSFHCLCSRGVASGKVQIWNIALEKYKISELKYPGICFKYDGNKYVFSVWFCESLKRENTLNLSLTVVIQRMTLILGVWTLNLTAIQIMVLHDFTK